TPENESERHTKGTLVHEKGGRMYGADKVRCVWRGIRYSSSFLEGYSPPRRATRDVQMLDLGRYRQMDDYSCGYMAGVAVVRCYRPEVDPQRLWAAVRPTCDEGCDEDRLLSALRRFGVRVRRRRGLGSREVFDLLGQGKPVIVLVDVPALETDHWAV